MFQTLGLYLRGLHLGTFPIVSTLEVIQVITWTAVFLIIVIQIAITIRMLGFFGSGLVGVLGVVGLLGYDLIEAVGGPTLAVNPWIEFHVAMAIFGYSVFGLLALTSGMYLMQDYSLTRKRAGSFYKRLPSISQLSVLMPKLLHLGIVFYGLAVLIGTFTWLSGTGHVSLVKVTASWAVLFAYLNASYMVYKRKASNKKLAIFNVYNFGLALLLFWLLMK